MTKSKLLVSLIIGLSLTAPVSAKIYKWVDDNGVTHMGDTIPAKYANKDRVEMNESGRVVKTTRFLNEEEKLAKKEAEAKELEAQKTKKAQKRYDDTLLYTYSSSDEIDLARRRNLQQVNARITSSNSQIKIAENSLQVLKEEAAARTAAGKSSSESLQQDLEQTKKRLASVKRRLQEHKVEKANLDARYDADKARYKKLTGR